METTVLITAFILIGLGVLVKRFPILIAGYNTMSKEEKMNVDVKGLSALCVTVWWVWGRFLYLLTTSFGTGMMPIGSLLRFPPILYIPYLDSQGE